MPAVAGQSADFDKWREGARELTSIVVCEPRPRCIVPVDWDTKLLSNYCTSSGGCRVLAVNVTGMTDDSPASS